MSRSRRFFDSKRLNVHSPSMEAPRLNAFRFNPGTVIPWPRPQGGTHQGRLPYKARQAEPASQLRNDEHTCDHHHHHDHDSLYDLLNDGGYGYQPT